MSAPTQLRPTTPPGRARTAWLRLVLFVLCAFSLDNLVTQTHVHLDRPAAATATVAVGMPQVARPDHPGKRPEQCPICRELAQSGHYLAAAPVTLVARVVARVLPQPAAPLAGVTPRRIRIWRSRGPPAPLQP